MFNNKRIKELERRVWELENPPVFKIGEKIEYTYPINRFHDSDKFETVFGIISDITTHVIGGRHYYRKYDMIANNEKWKDITIGYASATKK